MGVWPYVETADHILHAGDVCDPSLLDELKMYAPVDVVAGNCDAWDVKEWGATAALRELQLPEEVTELCEPGWEVYLELIRVGGRWRYVMTANEGFEVAFHGTYREIAPNERLVTTEVFEGAPVDNEDEDAALNFVTFEETNGRTILTTLVECHTQEVRDIIIESGMEGGMQEAMDKLEDVAVSLDDGQ
jgi:uncharacterized protein YndB with AHSA1/START domain